MTTDNELARAALQIKRLSIEMCQQRGGYAAQGVALAETAAVLFERAMRYDGEPGPNEPRFHDRFVLSNGHDAIVVYAALEQRGVYTRQELIDGYGAFGSRIEMSPLEQAVPGFEITAGSLGEGPSQAAGIAFGERLRDSDRRVYCLLSDGELQEGNVWEAAMFAGHHCLNNLVLIIDNNDMQATGPASEVLAVEPVADKFIAFGFTAISVDGSDIGELRAAFEKANSSELPVALIVNTRLFGGLPQAAEKYSRAHFWRVSQASYDQVLAEIDQKIAATSKS